MLIALACTWLVISLPLSTQEPGRDRPISEPERVEDTPGQVELLPSQPTPSDPQPPLLGGVVSEVAEWATPLSFPDWLAAQPLATTGSLVLPDGETLRKNGIRLGWTPQGTERLYGKVTP
jgi:hypothetical protein